MTGGFWRRSSSGIQEPDLTNRPLLSSMISLTSPSTRRWRSITQKEERI